tara:strand:- start:1752 stop:1883 length:132 start_codon:yes stop_codon:yes gene_type:complete
MYEGVECGAISPDVLAFDAKRLDFIRGVSPSDYNPAYAFSSET